MSQYKKLLLSTSAAFLISAVLGTSAMASDTLDGSEENGSSLPASLAPIVEATENLVEPTSTPSSSTAGEEVKNTEEEITATALTYKSNFLSKDNNVVLNELAKQIISEGNSDEIGLLPHINSITLNQFDEIDKISESNSKLSKLIDTLGENNTQAQFKQPISNSDVEVLFNKLLLKGRITNKAKGIKNDLGTLSFTQGCDINSVEIDDIAEISNLLDRKALKNNIRDLVELLDLSTQDHKALGKAIKSKIDSVTENNLEAINNNVLELSSQFNSIDVNNTKAKKSFIKEFQLNLIKDILDAGKQAKLKEELNELLLHANEMVRSLKNQANQVNIKNLKDVKESDLNKFKQSYSSVSVTDVVKSIGYDENNSSTFAPFIKTVRSVFNSPTKSPAQKLESLLTIARERTTDKTARKNYKVLSNAVSFLNNNLEVKIVDVTECQEFKNLQEELKQEQENRREIESRLNETESMLEAAKASEALYVKRFNDSAPMIRFGYISFATINQINKGAASALLQQTNTQHRKDTFDKNTYELQDNSNAKNLVDSFRKPFITLAQAAQTLTETPMTRTKVTSSSTTSSTSALSTTPVTLAPTPLTPQISSLSDSIPEHMILAHPVPAPTSTAAPAQKMPQISGVAKNTTGTKAPTKSVDISTSKSDGLALLDASGTDSSDQNSRSSTSSTSTTPSGTSKQVGGIGNPAQNSGSSTSSTSTTPSGTSKQVGGIGNPAQNSASSTSSTSTTISGTSNTVTGSSSKPMVGTKPKELSKDEVEKLISAIQNKVGKKVQFQDKNGLTRGQWSITKVIQKSDGSLELTYDVKNPTLGFNNNQKIDIKL